jgi:hypothetical protein
MNSPASASARDVPVLRHRISHPSLWLTIGLIAVPFVAAVISVTGHSWHPSGDQAVELLRIRDVGGSHTPLLGMSSRWGWAHPGPLLFWSLAPFYRAFGTKGVLVGVAAINLASVIGFVVVAYRRGGALGAALGGLAGLLVVHAVGLDLLIDPWNPWVAFLPFLCFGALAWSALCGDVVSLPIAVVVGSFVVQAHFGYLPLVAGLLLLAAAVTAGRSMRRWQRERAVDPPRTDRRPVYRDPLVLTGVFGIVCWAPAILQEATGHPRNLSALVSFIRHPSEAAAGWTTAIGTMGEQLRPIGPWIGGHETTAFGTVRTASTIWAVATVALVIATGWWARKRGANDAAHLAAMVLTAVVIAVIATDRVTGLFVPYVLRWWWGVAALAYLSIAWSLLFGAGRRSISLLAERAARAGMAVVVVVLLLQLPAAAPEASVSTATGAVTQSTASALKRDRRYLVRGVDRSTLADPGGGLLLALTARGYHVFSDRTPQGTLTYGSWRVASPDDVDAIVTMVAMPDVGTDWQPPPHSRVVATYDPLTPRQRDHSDRLVARIRKAVGTHAPPLLLLGAREERDRLVREGAKRVDVDALAELQAAGEGFVVFVSPADRRT